MPVIDPCRKYGLIAPSLEDTQDAQSIILASEGLSETALKVGVYLARVACPTTGEAIERIETIAAGWKVSVEDVLLALAEIEASGVILFYRVTEGGLVHAEFDLDVSAYYGDDLNLPEDYGGPEQEGFREDALMQEDLARSEYGDDELPVTDPNPKRARVFAKTGNRCFYCIERWAEHVDHMHPRCRGGSDADGNLIGACRTCNIRKKDRTVEEYRAYLAYRQRLPSVAHVRFYGEPVQ